MSGLETKVCGGLMKFIKTAEELSRVFESPVSWLFCPHIANCSKQMISLQQVLEK